MAKERYLRMQHDCFDALAVVPMSDGERRVMMVVIRYTVGFHRYDTDLSNRFISEFLGNMTEQWAGKCVNSLCEKGYIKIVSPGKGTHPRRIRFCYTEFRGKFRTIQRKLLDDLEESLEPIRGNSRVSKENKGQIKEEKKNKETLQATSFSPNRGREPEVSEEDWQRLLAEQWEDEE